MSITDASVKRILVIRLSSAGDIILTSPVLRVLRALLPEWEIHALTLREFLPLYAHSPCIDRLHSLDRGLGSAGLRRYRKEFSQMLGTFDVVVDLHGSIRSRIVRRGLGRRLLTIRKPWVRKRLLVWLGWNRLRPVHPVPLLYVDATAPLGGRDDGGGLELSIGDTLSPIKPDSERKTWVLAPGARHKTKAWPPAKWGELARLLSGDGSRIVLLGGPDEVAACNEVAVLSCVPHQIVNLAGTTSLLQAAAIVDLADCVIANDSALAHISVARGRPTVAIFGSTVQEFGFAPFRGLSAVVERTDVLCRPCSTIGRDDCPKGHFNCMEKIEAGTVFEAATRLSAKG